MKKFQVILFPVTNVTNVTKGKSMINHLFQHLLYETNVTGFFLVHVEIRVTNVTNGKYTESDDSRRNKGNKKKILAIFFPVTNVTNVTKGKSMINHPFQHFQYETNVTGFFLVHVEISVTNVTNGKYTESDDSRRNKGNEKKIWAIFFPVTNVTNVTKGKSMINHPFQHLLYETNVTEFFLVHVEISVTNVTNGKYTESDDSRRNKGNEKKIWAIFSPVTNVTNVTKGKSMINHPFQHFQYETNVTGFFLVHVEISVTNVTNGKYTESDDSRRNKGNEKKIWAIFFPVTNVTNVTKGKSMINHPFQHFQYETNVTEFFLVHVEISVTKVTNGKYTESDDSRRNKGNEKKFWAIFFPVTNVTNVTKGKSMINHPFQHFQYETNVTGFFLVHVEISVTNVTNGKYTESDDSRRNKGNEKKFWAIFFPVTNVTNVTKGKSMINHPFQHLLYETNVTEFFLVHVEISVTNITNGKYTESDDSRRNKR